MICPQGLKGMQAALEPDLLSRLSRPSLWMRTYRYISKSIHRIILDYQVWFMMFQSPPPVLDLNAKFEVKKRVILDDC